MDARMPGDQQLSSDPASAQHSDANAIAVAGSKSSQLGGELLSAKPKAIGENHTRSVHARHSTASPKDVADASSREPKSAKDSSHPVAQKKPDPAPALFTSYSAFQRSSNAYWHKVDLAKHKHILVAEFPPVFVKPDAPTVPPPPDTDLLNSKGTLPTLNDMTTASKGLARFAFADKKQPNFDLSVIDETEFKRRYTSEAVRIGQENGFDKTHVQTIVQGIYSFEDGGWGTHDTLSGMPSALAADDAPGTTTIADMREHYHPKSTGVGYNQLLRATTMLNLDQHSADIVAGLKQNAAKDPARHDILLAKADLVEHLKETMDKELKLMGHNKGGKLPNAYLSREGVPTDLLYHTFANSNAKTSSGAPASEIANAIHSLNLDGDIGPIIQAQELSGLLNYAHSENFEQLLTNVATKITTSASAYDALPDDKKTKAVDELLALVHPANISASSTIPISDQDISLLRTKLLNLKAGADDSIDRQNLTKGQYAVLNLGILTLKREGEQTGPLSADAALLMDKLIVSYRGGVTAQSLIPAAVELINLAGPESASEMLAPANGKYPTVNFFTRPGYNANGITNGRSADELIMQIDRIMHGLNRDPQKPGQAQFEKVFQE
jgi:hypothetical protein